MSGPNARRILLADDDEVTREVLGMMLEEAGYEYETVTTGEAAVSRALASQFAAIIMDYEMPVLNGLEATLRIRRLEQGKKTPIIILSAHTEKRDSAVGAGASAYLVKPVTLGTLRTTLASWTSEQDSESDPIFADVERHGDLLQLFFELVPERLKHMREAAQRHDMAAIRSEAHRLIGSCAVLGFPRMAAVARQVARGEIGANAGVAQLDYEFDRIAVGSGRDAACLR